MAARSQNQLKKQALEWLAASKKNAPYTHEHFHEHLELLTFIEECVIEATQEAME